MGSSLPLVAGPAVWHGRQARFEALPTRSRSSRVCAQRRASRSTVARLDGIAYRHLLVAYDGTSEGDEAVIAADLLAQRDGARLTIVVTVELEERLLAATRLPRGRGVWNDVLLDRARADLERARRLIWTPAELTVLFGPARRAIPDGAREFGCDAIMLPPRPRGRLRRLLSRDQSRAIRRHAPCQILRPEVHELGV
jgi:nucleotide-binding universal stress UspA family protein